MSTMEVTIKDTTTIYPSYPPFNNDHILPLSHLDNDPNLRLTFLYFRVYAPPPPPPPHHHQNPFDVITAALSSALVAYYPFTGVLFRHNSGRLELHCRPGRGVTVVRATVDSASLESVNYLDDPDEALSQQLVPDPDQNAALQHPLILQITTFACGGYVLGSAVHGALCDGLGGSQFFNAVAQLARGPGQCPVEPVWDRAILLGPRDPPRVEYPFYEKLSFDRDCNNVRVRASKLAKAEKVKFANLMNIRKVLKPPLPEGYWGNGCAHMYVHLTAGDLVEQPIWETAKLIKETKYEATDEYVRSYIDFQSLNYDKGISAGKEVSGFTDWRHLGHSSVDFGSGGPVVVFPVARQFLGSIEPCFFLPCFRSMGEGEGEKFSGFRVLVNLRESAMDDFKLEMDKFSRQDFA